MIRPIWPCMVVALAGAMPVAADAKPVRRPSATVQLRRELQDARAELARQQALIDAQGQRLTALEQKLAEAPPPAQLAAAAPLQAAPPETPAARSAVIGAAQGSAASTPGDPSTIQQAPLAPVGEAPKDEGRPPEVAVLGQQGSVVTRRGQLTAEAEVDYARADRNRALFRGIELVDAVLVGVFDINESRQDVITTSAALRYGLTGRMELGVRVPFVHRSDHSVLTPIQGTTADSNAASIDTSADGNGIGDVELSARYQLLDAHGGWPYLIGNLQVVAPTGTNPFDVPRDPLGEATKAATGAGFWGVSPSVTAILPSDPAVLFGTLGYTYNFGRGVHTEIPPVMITYVKPGNALSFSGGIGIALNQRTSLNLGYAHSWVFGTRTRTRELEQTGSWSGEVEARARDLQLGRLLFGMTYRVNDRASINWSVEVGATDDATDLRTVLRIPILLLTGG